MDTSSCFCGEQHRVFSEEELGIFLTVQDTTLDIFKDTWQHFKLLLFQQNQVFLRRREEISIHSCGDRNQACVKDTCGHIQPFLWRAKPDVFKGNLGKFPAVVMESKTVYLSPVVEPPPPITVLTKTCILWLCLTLTKWSICLNVTSTALWQDRNRKHHLNNQKLQHKDTLSYLWLCRKIANISSGHRSAP